MKKRVLKPATIIPNELYVERAADRHLQEIIEDMGRPGCILVARQMGKTNLLLHAKRKLENNSHTFVYVDLSTHVETAQECFRNIIDVAIDSNFNLFENIESEVAARREKNVLSPVKEHERELRILLQNIKGKLIIILDEIDALTNASYSDKIFAQIRSTYFAGRTNYQEFNRLTYILSGVLEPTEIIANKKISPFNIADKIFLEDFKFHEFENFLAKASLVFEDEIVKHIYSWTNGNPRITWDLCSAIESRLLKKSIVSKEEIDILVNELYLTDFDRAPIDHIRELVEGDSKIRDAVVTLKYKKGKTLSDSIKKKLYLAGIINSDYGVSDIKIKNRIISKSLSDEWIYSVERTQKDLYVLATEKMVNTRYIEAVDLFVEYVDKNKLGNEVLAGIYYDIGFCYSQLAQFQKSILFSQKAQKLADKDSNKQFYYNCEHQVALCYYYLNNWSDSIDAYTKIIEHHPKGLTYLKALLTRASCYIRVDASRYYKYIREDYDIILNYELGDNERELEELRGITYYNLAFLDIELGILNNKQELIKYLEISLSLVKDESSKPKLYLLLLNLIEEKSERREIINECIRRILDNKLQPSKVLAGITLGNNEIFSLIIAAFNNDIELSIIKKVVDHGILYFPPNEYSYSFEQYILYAASFYVYNTEIEISKAIDFVLSNQGLSKQTHFYAYQTIILRGIESHQISSYLEVVDKYILILKDLSKENFSLSTEDLRIYSDLSEYYLGKNSLDKLNRLNEIYLEKESSVDIKTKGDFALIYNNATLSNFRLYEKHSNVIFRKDAIKYAQKAINFCKTVKEDSLSILGKQALNVVVSNAKGILNALGERKTSITIRRKKPKYRKNERVRVRYVEENKEKDDKYKNLRKDIENGNCIVIKRYFMK